MSAQPLGAILAGGRSSRFGSDKASADIAGRAMLDRVADAHRPQCAELVVIGRDWPGLTRIEDRPAPGLGPLGGLAGALAYAGSHGHAHVLTSGCDLPALAPNLVGRLAPADAVLADQPTIGLWRSELAGPLLAWIAANERRSIFAWAAHAGARLVPAPPLVNVNRPEDLDAFRRRGGPRSSR